MPTYPEITDSRYHDMSFDDVEKLREKLKVESALLINDSQLLLYLNQLEKRYSTKIKMSQNISIFSFISAFIVIFINWKLSPIFFIMGIIAGQASRNLAKRFIYKQCLEDTVFLKFALAVGLVKLNTE